MSSLRLSIATSAIALGLLGSCVTPAHGVDPRPHARAPNIVLIFADDLGYGDLSCYGHPTIQTPQLDALAASGTKLTQFYVASPVCSPSRAALLTGCYPKRVGMQHHVIFPQHDYGLHTDELTIADLLRAEGYATGAFGKWHLGHRPGLLPTDQGFDEFLGVPYSNDMARYHRAPDAKYRYRLPLLHNDEVVEWEPDQHLLTRRYTAAAVQFIDEHHDQPFFVYLPHSMPHVPIYASADFEGTSPRGLYGDVIAEIDWSVGQLIAALERHDLRDDTLVIFTSDNGPWLQFRLRGGSAGLLRGGKGTNWEGGQREPFIASWPGVIPAGGLCSELTTAMDLLPTLAQLTGATLPTDRTIDGHDITDLLLARAGARSPTEQFLYYTSNGDLAGIRSGPWKLLLGPTEPNNAELYDVEQDVSEKWNVADEHPELVTRLHDLAVELDLRITAEARPVRTVEAMAFDPNRPDGDAR